MYGHLRDLCIEVLGYPPSAVDIDRSGARGRPDLTIFAPGGADNERVAWIVLEAKDESGICRDSDQRAALFAEKSKYITADTAWFVMVDPATWVARPADRGSDPGTDTVLDLESVSFEQFREQCVDLRADVAGVPGLLERFRDGDETLIAGDRLSGTDDPLLETIARNVFFDGLEETTQRLQAAAVSALGATGNRRRALSEAVRTFSDRYRGCVFYPYPVSIEGKPQGRDEAIEHGRDVQDINRTLAAEPALARLTLSALPKFAERTGIDPTRDSEKLERFFATETANLILARILLIRFLEDYGFFDETTADGVVKRRYLCNGGVHAFQGMRAYFGQHYTRLLEDAYRTGAKVFSAAFKETEHDWVLDLSDEMLSRNIEWAMYRFARFDFTTIRGDILSGMYDRFLDAKQRKAQGEFYTPPSIARYMLDRLDLAPDDRVLDPCCGSGTFLIERYQQVVGEDAERGIATYDDARQAIVRIAGNDLNPFSAVLTQIQLLWHLLSFGEEVKSHGLPAIRVSERANSLVPTDLLTQATTRFSDIDVPGYAAVIGNPPYVRPERGVELETTARLYYKQGVTVRDRVHAGISPDRNLYNLFIYRALDYWCSAAEGEEAGRPGKLAFVIPLGFCAAKSSADLRALFAFGGRWTITELVDMELIWKHVFDARVLPMIVFAEARPPRKDDVVTLRHVDEVSVKRGLSNHQSRPMFDLSISRQSFVPYADLFTPEGHIATRLTPARAAIVRKLRGLGQLSEAAKRYWTKSKGGYLAVDVEPGAPGRLHWEERRMIAEGIARRGTGSTGHPQGLDVYKGENIRTGDLVGQPAFKGLDVSGVSQPSLWRFPSILPARMWCLPIIEQIPCAAAFDPKRVALTNTATVFGPRSDLEDYPFDMLLTSRIYGWFTLLSLRSSYLDMLRSHMYPATVIAKLPWSADLVAIASKLVDMREGFFADCRARQDIAAERIGQARDLGLVTLKSAFSVLTARRDRLVYSSEFKVESTFELDLVTHGGSPGADDSCTVAVSSRGHRLTFPNQTIARYARLGFELAAGCEVSRSKLLDLLVPDDETTAHNLRALLDDFDPVRIEAKVLAHVDRIDRLVGGAMGLSDDEIDFVQKDMRDDPFFTRVRPRYPYFTPAQRGRRTSLESAHRYC